MCADSDLRLLLLPPMCIDFVRGPRDGDEQMSTSANLAVLMIGMTLHRRDGNPMDAG
jgi:hypothetical protein